MEKKCECGSDINELAGQVASLSVAVADIGMRLHLMASDSRVSALASDVSCLENTLTAQGVAIGEKANIVDINAALYELQNRYRLIEERLSQL